MHMTPSDLDIFVASGSMCPSKFNLLSIVVPRYFIVSLIFILLSTTVDRTHVQTSIGIYSQDF